MSQHREILAALGSLRSGATSLNFEEYVQFLDAVEQLAETLQLAPGGSDPVATGVWWHHERTPALARLADALPTPRGAAPRRRQSSGTELGDAPVIRALHQSILENSPYRGGK
jgi:hypothetical protein